MPGVSKEQIERAKEWDLLSYLQAREPQELKRCGVFEFCLKSHDSLKISNGKWNWHSQGIGGKTALDYLIKVRGMDFVSAVETLCGERAAVVQMPTEKQGSPRPFVLPEKNRVASAAVTYLQSRGIAADIIGRSMGNGTLYESKRHHNCVFVGRDQAGKARYAFLRGTGGTFKQEISGSDKRYGFYLSAADPASPYLAVTESAIDALSVASLVNQQGGEWSKAHYLSLGGTSPRALVQFLKDHPNVSCISLCLDADKAGTLGMAKIHEAVEGDRELKARVKVMVDNPPSATSGCKDYNQLLVKKEAQRRQERKRQDYDIAM